jgi:hypothetical protein
MFENSEEAAPIDQAPGLQPFGTLANRVVKLTKAYRPLSQRVLFAPTAAFHAYAIAIRYWNTNTNAAGFARHLYKTDPRDLVRSAFATPAPALFRALKRAGKHAQTPEFYVRLNLLLSHAEIADAIFQVKEITPVVVDFFYKVRARKLDPLVFAAHQHLEHKFSRALGLHDVLQVCRQFDIVPEEKVAIAAMRRSTGYVQEIINRWFEGCKSHHNLQGLPPELTQLKTGAELNAISRAHKNCLHIQKYKIHLASGARIFILYREELVDQAVEAVATLAPQPGCQNMWIDECMHSNRQHACRAVRVRITELLSEAGIQAAPRSFQSAWDEFVYAEAAPNFEDLIVASWANQS